MGRISYVPWSLVWRRSAHFQADGLIPPTAQSSPYLGKLGTRSTMPKYTFRCVILCSFIYLCSTMFQNLFEPDCFSASVSNLPSASTPQSKGWKARQHFRAESSGRPLIRGETSLQLWSCQLTSHTSAQRTQLSPWGRMHYR